MVADPNILQKEVRFVQLIRSGNKKAEREFYDYCYEYCLHANGKQDFFSQDCFQETFLQIWTEIQDGRIFLANGVIWRSPKFIGAETTPMTCTLRSFIVDICKKQAIKKRRGSAIIFSTTFLDISDDDYDAFAREDEEEKLRIVHASIDEMSVHCRDILTLYYVNGFSMEQIMRKRNAHVSKDGLKSSKSKCLQRLRHSVISTYIALQSR